MKFALLGYPLSHTFSPKIFGKIFEIAGIEGEYHVVELPTRRLFYHAVCELLESGFDGLNVTIPYKQDAFLLAERRSQTASRTMNANFIYKENGLIRAENTDYWGLRKSIESEIELKNLAGAVIGYGGAAQTSSVLLSDLGFEKIFVIARNPEKAEKAFNAIKNTNKASEFVIISDAGAMDTEIDILINASPAGMYPKVNELPHGSEAVFKLRTGGVLVDLIYNPKKTKLMEIAEKRGLKALNGLKMLVYQAVNAFEIIADKKVSAGDILIWLEKQYE